MDHLGVSYQYFYNLRERACAEMMSAYDAKGVLEEVDEKDYLMNVVRLLCMMQWRKMQHITNESITTFTMPTAEEIWYQNEWRTIYKIGIGED